MNIYDRICGDFEASKFVALEQKSLVLLPRDRDHYITRTLYNEKTVDIRTF